MKVRPQFGLNEKFSFQPSAVLVTRALRGFWLVKSLLHKGWKVTVINWPMSTGQVLSDIEGPFPLFAGPEIEDDMVKAYNLFHTKEGRGNLSEQDMRAQIWLQHGPMQFGGPLGVHHMRKLGVAETVIDEIGQGGAVDPNLSRLSYKNVWPHLFVRQAAALTNQRQIYALETGRAISAGRQMYLRDLASEDERVTWERLGSGKNDFRYVELDPKGSQLKIAGGKGKFSGILIDETDLTEDALIWALAAEETVAAVSKDSDWIHVFDGAYEKWRTADWFWMGFAFELDVPEHIGASLPPWFVVAQDIDLPWYSENFIILRKSTLRSGWMAWMRLPINTINDELRENGFWEKCVRALGHRIPNAKFKRVTQLKPRVGVRVEPKGNRGALLSGSDYILIGPDRWFNWTAEDALLFEAKANSLLDGLNRTWIAESQAQYRREQERLARAEQQRLRNEEKERMQKERAKERQRQRSEREA